VWAQKLMLGRALVHADHDEGAIGSENRHAVLLVHSHASGTNRQKVRSRSRPTVVFVFSRGDSTEIGIDLDAALAIYLQILNGSFSGIGVALRLR